MRSRWFGFGIAVVAAVVSILFFNRLPPEVPSHWNVRGEPDDWMSRTMAVMLLPLTILGASLLAQVVPQLDPRRRGDPHFQGTFRQIVNILLLFVLVVHVSLLANGAGAPVNPVRVIVIGLGILLVVLGAVIRRLEPNWFMGIRTPWTLESERVWRITHRMGGIAFMAAGFATLGSLWLPGIRPMWVGFVGVMVAAVGSAVLSLVLWLREKQAG